MYEYCSKNQGGDDPAGTLLRQRVLHTRSRYSTTPYLLQLRSRLRFCATAAAEANINFVPIGVEPDLGDKCVAGHSAAGVIPKPLEWPRNIPRPFRTRRLRTWNDLGMALEPAATCMINCRQNHLPTSGNITLAAGLLMNSLTPLRTDRG